MSAPGTPGPQRPLAGVDDPPELIVEGVDGVSEPEGPLASLFIHRATSPDVIETTHVASTPDIIGLEVLDAHAVTRRSGLRLAVSVWETKVGPWGMILSQQPDAGERVRVGARIHAVAAGRPHLAIPDVRGMNLRVAQEALRRLGLQPVVAEMRTSRTVGAGHVISTRPAAGTLVVDGSRVMVTVAGGYRAQDVPERGAS